MIGKSLSRLTLATIVMASGAALGSGLGTQVDLQTELRRLYYKPDLKGQSCGRCHTPTGKEFQLYDFSKADLVRRAKQHLTPEEAASIANLLTSSHLESNQLRSVDVPPYQPGGSVLSGDSVQARELNLATELSTLLPTLSGKPITTMAEAFRARDELLTLDPRKVQIGIPTSRISEDVFHGPDHASLADWFPDVPIAETPALLAAREAYEKAPTSPSLAQLLTALRQIRPHGPLEQLSIYKYASLLLWSQTAETSTRSAPTLSLINDWNPVWMVGELARLNEVGDPIQLGIPADVLAKKSGSLSLKDQMRALRLPWLWMGWTLDPSLFHSEGVHHATVRGDYFVQALREDGPYPIHTLFFLSKKLVEQGCRKKNWPLQTQQHFELQYTHFLIDGPLIQSEPKDPTYQAAFRNLASNSFRLSLRLLEDDLNRTRACIRPESQINQIRVIGDYFQAIHASASDLELCKLLITRLQKAKVDMR